MNLISIPYSRALPHTVIKLLGIPGLWASCLLRFPLLLLLLVMMHTAAGQQRVIEFAETLVPPLAVPALAQFPRAIVVHVDSLGRLEPGSFIEIQIAEDDFVQLQLRQLQSLINGDLTLSASGRDQYSDYQLTLTIGMESLFGYVSANESVWQLHARNMGVVYAGWVYRPGLLNEGKGLANDFILPDARSIQLEPPDAANDSAPRLPLKIGSDTNNQAGGANTTAEAIKPDNFSIQQTFNPDPVLPGETIQAEFLLHNSSAETHNAVVLEVYFLLEDSTLISAPVNCSESLSLSLQKVLRCELGNFAPGEKKTLAFAIETNATVGTQLLSTVVIDSLRHDYRVNVVEDVRTDSDSDGVSNFNELLAGTNPQDPSSVDFSVSTIDVMALYTPGAAAAYPGSVETRINQLVAVANQIYRDSGVAINLRLVHHAEVDYNDVDDMDTALDHLMDQSHGAFSNLASLRARYGADLVMLFRPLETTADRCGLAPVGGFRSNGYFDIETERQFAYSHIAIDCPVDIAVAHELGHNMGLTHSHREDGYGGTFNFSTGYGLDGQFVTVMAYPAAFGTENRIARFSDPLADCLGFACGVSGIEPEGADAVQTLNLVRHQIANYYPSTVPDPPASSVAALSGSTTAIITIAASRDDGLSFGSRFSPSDRVDLRASIKVDNRHIGQQGSLHVLVTERSSNDFYQLNELGELELWDGKMDSLFAVGGSRSLGIEEHLQLLDGFQFGEEMVGLELAIYIGYRVPASNDFIYTDSPLTLDIVRSQ